MRLRPPSSSSVARRLTGTVFAGVALGMIGLYAAITAAPLVAEDLTGARTWTGLPGAAAILGTATGAALLSELMARRGRRPGLAAGWLLGAVGAGVAVTATVIGSFPLLLSGMLVLGIGHGANQLARFAAADAHPPRRHGRVLSLVVWAGTIGAVIGPSLLDPAGRLVAGIGLPDLAGGFASGLAVFALAGMLAWAALRPDPGRLVAAPVEGSRPGGRGSLDRTTLMAVLALIVAQFVMVLIMTVTPVHVRGHDHGLGVVGIVISLHVLGMFGLAPVAGWLSDRYGGLRVALVGLLMVAGSAAGGAFAPPTSVPALATALLVLGLGWSAAFVASSSLLAASGTVIQGRADALGWGCAALASVVSGVLLGAFGYVVLCAIGLLLSLAAAAVILRSARRRPMLEAPSATSGSSARLS